MPILSPRRRRRTRHALADIGDPTLREGTIELFEETQRKIDEDGVDLVILCARRLACLYQLLVSNGHPQLTGALVVSDRFLDIANDWKWRNVLLLDDSIVLGTTLTHLFNDVSDRVHQSGGGTVACAAICVDQDKSAPYLLERLNLDPGRKVPAPEVQKFSKDVVSALYRNNIAFFSDFPVTRSFDINADAWLGVLSETGWHVADVTAPVVSSEHQTAFVQIPNEDLTLSTLSRMPPEVSRLVEAFKLRSYVTRATQDAEQVKVTMVPIAMLAACTEDELDEALASIGESLQLPALLGQDAIISGKAKHRLVQVYASAFVLAATVAEPARRALGENADWFDPQAVRLYFGPYTDAIVEAFGRLTKIVEATPPNTFEVPPRNFLAQPSESDLLSDDDLRALLREQRELLISGRSDKAPDQGQMTKVGLVAAHAISSIFGYVSQEFEDPQQAEIRALDSYEEYLEKFGADSHRRVLNQTLTMRELTRAILAGDLPVDAWDRALVSLGVDVGNDLGIVVPSTLYDSERDLFYRAYRLGETAQLAQRPLARWHPDDVNSIDELDAFSRSIAEGYPVRSYNTTIGFGTSRRMPAGSPDAGLLFEALKKVRRDSLPGAIVDSYRGTITVLDEDGNFRAEVTSLSDQHISDTVLSRAQVPEDQHHLLRKGAWFWWTIFEKDLETHKDRTSRIRLIEPPVLDPEVVEHAAQEFSFLADAE